jgi:predicted HAD superfamily Cof-like phosphohydrolase
MSNYTKVREFNEAFGLDVPSVPQVGIFRENPKLVELKEALIVEEVEELRQAIRDEHMIEVADALGDILYVVYGAGIAFGLDMDEIFSLIHDSNMSKLCNDEDEAKDTVLWYKEKYENNESIYDSPAYRYDAKSAKFVVYNERTGKVLKSINYKPVDLGYLVRQK